MKMKIFHGSKKIIEKPQFGVGKIHNDYGRGFYCTESLEIAKDINKASVGTVKNIAETLGCNIEEII